MLWVEPSAACNLNCEGCPTAAGRLGGNRKIKTQTHSNGILLNKNDMAQRIVDSGLTRISIGVDGIDQETYTDLRTGGKLVDVESGIKLLYQARERANKRMPKIIVECLLSNQKLCTFLGRR